MQLILTIADNTDGARLLNDICSATNYDPGSGITKADWVKAKLSDFLRVVAKRGEMKTTSATISAEIDAIVIT